MVGWVDKWVYETGGMVKIPLSSRFLVVEFRHWFNVNALQGIREVIIIC